MAKWRKNREIIFDFTGPGKIIFNSDQRHYETELLRLLKIEDYKACAALRLEAIENGLDVSLELPACRSDR